jgi:hypothetical protein
MDPLTLELFRCLQSAPYDESGLQSMRGLLSRQRRALSTQRDLATLGEIVQLLEAWAEAAGETRAGMQAREEAASIAERELRDAALAARLRAGARAIGRSLGASVVGAGASPASGGNGAVGSSRGSNVSAPAGSRGAAAAVSGSGAAGSMRGVSTPTGGRGAVTAAGGTVGNIRSARASGKSPGVGVSSTAHAVSPAGGAAAGARDVGTAVSGHADDHAAGEAAAYVAQARRCRAADDLDGAIEAYEQALNVEAELATVRQLADLFAMRAGPGDAQQAADLYCTLGDVLGNPEGIVMLERALAQRPEHPTAKALLATYTGKKAKSRRPVLDSASAHAALQAKVEQAPPLRALAPREPGKGPPPLGAAVFALPSGSPGAPVSSLTPVVRQDAVDALPEPRARPVRRWVAFGLIAAGAAAAGAFVMLQGRFPGSSAVTHSATTSSGTTASEVGAAALPTAAATPSSAVITTPNAAVGAPEGAATSAAVANNANTAAPANAVPPASAAPAANATGPTPSSALGAAELGTPAPAVAEAVVATAKDQAPPADGPAKPAGSKPAVQALLELAKLSGGKLNQAQLSAALEKTSSQLDRCYAQLLKKKPRAKGRLTFSWTVRLDGRVASLKKVSDTINDAALTQCTQQVIAETRFPKPRKQAAQVKLPFEYRRLLSDSKN